MTTAPSLPISASTRLCAVFGQPVRHSASPAMHNAGFAALGLDFRYIACEVAPERLKEALDAYLKDYAERALKQMQQSGSDPQAEQGGRTIRPEDLKSLLDKMQEMAKNGADRKSTRLNSSHT